jgi:hypothetical protein
VAATADQEGNLLIVTGVGSGGGAHVKDVPGERPDHRRGRPAR